MASAPAARPRAARPAGSGLRRAALALAGAGLVLSLLALATVPVFWPVLGSRILIGAAGMSLLLAGAVGLLIEDEGPRWARLGAVIVGGLAVAGGAVQGVTAKDTRLRDTARSWASETRSFKDADLGITVPVPDNWVVLKSGNPVAPDAEALLTAVEPNLGGVAVLRSTKAEKGKRLDQLVDDQLAREQASRLTLKETDRTDLAVGRAKGRLSKTSYAQRGRQLRWTAAWLDGPRLFQLTVSLPPGADAEEQALRFLRGVGFDAPVERALQETSERVSRECPMFSRDAVRRLLHVVPVDAEVHVFFKEGYSRAMAGLARRETLAVLELREITSELFEGMTPAQRGGLGDYIERLRNRLPTTAAEDRAMERLMTAALRRLPEDLQSRFREHIDKTLELSGLSL